MDDIKILIIDDEQINCDFFEVMLSHLGFKVFSETSGESGLTRISEINPDMILIDLNLSTMSGMDIIRSIEKEEEYEQFRSIPVILFSSHDDSDEKVEGFELGMEDYITKPFSFAEVLARIRGILKQRELYRQIISDPNSSIKTSLESIPLDEMKKSVNTILEGLEEMASNQVSEKVRKLIAVSESQNDHFEKFEDILSDISYSKDDNDQLHTRLSDMDTRFKKHIKEMKNAGR